MGKSWLDGEYLIILQCTHDLFTNDDVGNLSLDEVLVNIERSGGLKNLMYPLELVNEKDVIVEVEKTSKMDFVDESLIGDDIKEMYVHYKDLAKSTKDEFKKHVDFCIDESIGVKLDIMKGKLLE